MLLAVIGLFFFFSSKMSMIQDLPGSPVVKPSHFNARDTVSIPGWEAKIPQVLQTKNQNIKKKQYWNEFNKDLKKIVHIRKLKKWVWASCNLSLYVSVAQTRSLGGDGAQRSSWGECHWFCLLGIHAELTSLDFPQELMRIHVVGHYAAAPV